jgi:hypothetical protein
LSAAKAGPRGWSPGKSETRFADVAPSSYDAKAHTVDCVISMGSPVQRFYGVEKLRIDSSSIDTSRVSSGNCPFLDSHITAGISNSLGRVASTWVKSGALWGRIIFNQTAEGKNAESMIARGELRGISCGYSVQSWTVTDANGRAVDADSIGWNDEGYTYLATAWTLFEVSAVTVPADQFSGIRSLGHGDQAFVSDHVSDVLVRMQVRQRMSERNTAYFGEIHE